jgi:thiol-disulfide isomerase/thioredoxin
MKRIQLLIGVVLMMAIIDATAQTGFTPTELVNVVDGKPVSIQPCGTCVAMVVVFHSLKCPYDLHYAARIKKLVDQYGTNVSFFLVNANPDAEEQPDKMKAAYAGWGFNIPYLADKEQIVMTALAAKKTPEAVLLKKEGAKLKVVYQGAIDDNPQVHHDADVNFLENAINDLLAGKNPAVATERVIGCTIRKK